MTNERHHMTRRLLLALVALTLLPTAAMADSTDPDPWDHHRQTAEDGQTYDCLEWDDDAGCRTRNVSFDPETGTVRDMWVAPSRRIYWLPGIDKPGQYRWVPPAPGEPDPGPLVQPVPPLPAPGDEEGTSSYAYQCPDGSVYYY